MERKNNWASMPLGIRILLFAILTASIILICILLLSLPPQTPAAPVQSLPPFQQGSRPATPVDYVDVMRDPEAYDGKLISVSGRINDVGDNHLYFSERLGTDGDGLGFCVRFPYNHNSQKAYELYERGDCVTVEGIWHFSSVSSAYNELTEAVVTAVGEGAEKIAGAQLQAWRAEREEAALSAPLVDHMDIVSDPARYEGSYVRLAGQVDSITVNKASYHAVLSFRSRDTWADSVSVWLKGCPQEMQDLCTEGEYVLVCGTVSDIFSLYLKDCYVLAVGEEAKAAYDSTAAAWLQGWASERAAFIPQCAPLDYDEFIHYPDRHRDERISAEGSVLDVHWQYAFGRRTADILLDIGGGQIVSITYSGALKRDPEIIPGDVITFYGTARGNTSCETISGGSFPAPHIEALYSSINQLPE